MSVLRGQRIRLKFYLSNAVLYFLERRDGVSVVGLDGEFERPPVVFEQIVRIPVGVGFLSLELASTSSATGSCSGRYCRRFYATLIRYFRSALIRPQLVDSITVGGASLVVTALSVVRIAPFSPPAPRAARRSSSC